MRAVEEAAYAEAHLRDARTLARSGRIGGITVDDGTFLAAVADGDEVWTVSGGLPVLDEGRHRDVGRDGGRRVGSGGGAVER